MTDEVAPPRDLRQRWTDTQRLLNRTLGEDIEVMTVLEPQLPSVVMDQSKLEQVLMNAIVNARAAFHRPPAIIEVCPRRRVGDTTDPGCIIGFVDIVADSLRAAVAPLNVARHLCVLPLATLLGDETVLGEMGA